MMLFKIAGFASGFPESSKVIWQSASKNKP